MEINIKESTIIRPAQETPKHCLWLSNLDIIMPASYYPVVQFYRRPNYCSNFFDAVVLKQALSNVLVPFYPMAGRLGRDENGRPEMRCNAEGVLFLVAETTFAVEDFGEFMPSSKLRQLVPTIDHTSDISSCPLILFQVTHFKCGGVCLGILMHHTVLDGTSLMHFLKSWAEMARGIPLSIRPFLDRTILRNGIPSYPTFYHIEYEPPPTLKTVVQTQELQSSPEPTSIAFFKISPDHIKGLKAKSNKDRTNPVSFSTYEILLAHIWRCVSKARGLPEDEESQLYISTDGRARLNPPVPRGYFGNLLFHASSTGKSGDIQSEPFACTVERVHKAIKRMDDAYLKSALAYLDQHSDLETLKRGAKTYNCPNLSVTSWHKLPTHDADFGWGRPIYTGQAGIPFEGKGFILSSPSNDGSLSLIICLETDHMEVFKKCFYGEGVYFINSKQ